MKSKKLPSVMILLILTAITALFWVSFNVYRVFTDEPSPVVAEEVILQLDPTLDIQTINMMKGKIYP